MMRANVAWNKPVPNRLCHWTLLALALLMMGRVAIANGTPGDYDIHYHARFMPEAREAHARMTVTQTAGELEWLDFTAPDNRVFDFAGDGEITRSEGRVLWRVPAEGGTLTYRVRVERKRGKRFDARITDDWVIMRLDHLFPSARVMTKGREVSRPTLSLDGPDGWAFETRYGSGREPVKLPPSDRRFVRPTGWMAAGRLSIRRDRIADRHVVITGPLEERLRSQDLLAFLRWNLPTLVEIFPSFPERILIVNAGDPMWRGGLSGPGSFYMHSSRPLISANGTSTLLHELVHVATISIARPSNDWIVEGIAEYYSLEILRRSGSISDSRFRRAIRRQAQWAEREDARLRSPSKGADTARAVVVFHALDRELQRAGLAGLDVVATPLLEGPPLSLERLLELTEAALGRPARALTEALEAYLDAPAISDR